MPAVLFAAVLPLAYLDATRERTHESTSERCRTRARPPPVVSRRWALPRVAVVGCRPALGRKSRRSRCQRAVERADRGDWASRTPTPLHGGRPSMTRDRPVPVAPASRLRAGRPRGRGCRTSGRRRARRPPRGVGSTLPPNSLRLGQTGRRAGIARPGGRSGSGSSVPAISMPVGDLALPVGRGRLRIERICAARSSARPRSLADPWWSEKPDRVRGLAARRRAAVRSAPGRRCGGAWRWPPGTGTAPTPIAAGEQDADLLDCHRGLEWPGPVAAKRSCALPCTIPLDTQQASVGARGSPRTREMPTLGCGHASEAWRYADTGVSRRGTSSWSWKTRPRGAPGRSARSRSGDLSRIDGRRRGTCSFLPGAPRHCSVGRRYHCARRTTRHIGSRGCSADTRPVSGRCSCSPTACWRSCCSSCCRRPVRRRLAGHLAPAPRAAGVVAIAYAVAWVVVLWLHGLYRPRARWTIRSEGLAIARATVVLGLDHRHRALRLPAAGRQPPLPAPPVPVAVAADARRRAIALRLAFEWLRARGYNQRYVLVVGAGPRGAGVRDEARGPSRARPAGPWLRRRRDAAELRPAVALPRAARRDRDAPPLRGHRRGRDLPAVHASGIA